MTNPASVLLREVRDSHPTVFDQIVHLLKPYTIESLERIFGDHLEHSPVSLDAFNKHRDRIPSFLLRYVLSIRKNFPSGGNPTGIQRTCSFTSNDTQEILNSRHLKRSLFERDDPAATEDGGCRAGKKRMTGQEDGFSRAVRYEMDLYSEQSQILEIACKRKCSSVYLRRDPSTTIAHLASVFRAEYCILAPFSRTAGKVVSRGVAPRLARFLMVEASSEGDYAATTDPETPAAERVLYHRHHSRDLAYLLTHLPPYCIEAFADVRQVFDKCGPTCYFFNTLRIVRRRFGRDPKHFRDLVVAVRFQVSTGRLLLPLNREGLSKHVGRSPFEASVFEAMKKIFAVQVTRPNEGCVGICYSEDEEGSPSECTTEGDFEAADGTGEPDVETPARDRPRRKQVRGYLYPACKNSTDQMMAGITFRDGTGFDNDVVPHVADRADALPHSGQRGSPVARPWALQRPR